MNIIKYKNKEFSFGKEYKNKIIEFSFWIFHYIFE